MTIDALEIPAESVLLDSRAPSAGQRFVESEPYLRVLDAGGFAGGHPREWPGVEVLDAAELRAALALRTYSDLAPFAIEGVPYPGYQASAANVPGLAETIPVTGLQVYLGPELTEQVEAGAVNDGQPLPEPNVNFGTYATAPTKLPRYGVGAPISLGVLDEPGQVASIIDRRLRLGFPLGLERDILGNPALETTAFWTGILALPTSAAGDQGHAIAIAKGGAYRCDAITDGIAAVQTNGWYQQALHIISHPTTRASTYKERDSQQRPISATDMFDSQIDAWYVSKYMPVGTAIVADVFNAVALLQRGPLEVAISREHADFFARGLVELTLATRLYAWVRQAGAIAVVTGL